MNEHDEDQWLKNLCVEKNLLDEGFSGRIMAALPKKRRSHGIILAIFALLGGVFTYLLLPKGVPALAFLSDPTLLISNIAVISIIVVAWISRHDIFTNDL